MYNQYEGTRALHQLDSILAIIVFNMAAMLKPTMTSMYFILRKDV